MTKAVTLIVAPYDSGRRDWRMGAGPAVLAPALSAALAAAGYDVERIGIEVNAITEAQTAFAIAREVARAVRESHTARSLPIVLSGNCSSCWGTVAGCGPDTRVIWFDAHGDLNTPETTASGFLDGMALATLTGRCWRQMTASIPGFQPVADDHVALIAARDLDPPERALLDGSAITWVPTTVARDRQRTHEALSAALARSSGAYVHVDLDVLDPAVARANEYSVPGGLEPRHLVDLIAVIGTRSDIRAAALTAFDPSYDTNGHLVAAAIEIARALAAST